MYKVKVWNYEDNPEVVTPFEQIFKSKVDLTAFVDIVVEGCKSVGIIIETVKGWDDDDDDF